VVTLGVIGGLILGLKTNFKSRPDDYFYVNFDKKIEDIVTDDDKVWYGDENYFKDDEEPKYYIIIKPTVSIGDLIIVKFVLVDGTTKEFNIKIV
jgi:hypothetical protein